MAAKRGRKKKNDEVKVNIQITVLIIFIYLVFYHVFLQHLLSFPFLDK